MAIREIATLGHPVLRQRARELSLDELRSASTQQFIDDLIATMRHANGAGLAANQVFEPIQICALEVRDNNPRYPYKPQIPLTILVNPKITPLSDAVFENFEGCLSVPNLRGRVHRYEKVRVQAWDREGHELDYEAAGITAGTYQHECDHLEGVLFVDRLCDTRSLCTWEHFETYEKSKFVTEAQAVVARLGS